jgi:hypothetical protein
MKWLVVVRLPVSTDREVAERLQMDDGLAARIVRHILANLPMKTWATVGGVRIICNGNWMVCR